jgi:[acyl-carrier-protein] S-malonyltransferase
MPGDAIAARAAGAIGFPGQGGDWRAAIATLEAHPDEPLVSALADRLGSDRWRDLDGLDTRNMQPVVYTAGLVGDGPQPGAGQIVAAIGHSLGEITASAWAGAIDPVAGLDLVVTRAALGHAAHEKRPGAMVAISRWRAEQVEWLRREVLADHVGILEVAVVNSPEQTVLSGDAALVDLAAERANDRGAVARHLPIGGAYHSPLMASELEAFRIAVDAAVTAPPAVPVVSSTSARPIRDRDDLVDVLVRSLVLPVRWADAVSALHALGVSAALDAGPGDTLVRLGRFLPDVSFTAA